jgi:hypothetical protein
MDESITIVLPNGTKREATLEELTEYRQAALRLGFKLIVQMIDPAAEIEPTPSPKAEPETTTDVREVRAAVPARAARRSMRPRGQFDLAKLRVAMGKADFSPSQYADSVGAPRGTVASYVWKLRKEDKGKAAKR